MKSSLSITIVSLTVVAWVALLPATVLADVLPDPTFWSGSLPVGAVIVVAVAVASWVALRGIRRKKE